MFNKKKAVVIPEWASILEEKEYIKFIEALDQYFIRNNQSYSINDGILKVASEDFEFGLTNLVQRCKQVDISDYAYVVKDHFDQLYTIKGFEKEFNDKKGNFDNVKEYLGVRLYDKEYINVLGENYFVTRHFAGELFMVLVWDFPSTIQMLNQSDMKLWDKTEDELFEIGMSNIQNQYEFNISEMDLGGTILYHVNTNHFYAPNILFELEKHPQLLGKGGAIIAAPNRHTAVIYPIQDMKVSSVLTMFFINIPTFFKQGPGSLSQEVYWYHNGQIEVLEYESGDQIKFKPSKEFLALLSGGLNDQIIH